MSGAWYAVAVATIVFGAGGRTVLAQDGGTLKEKLDAKLAEPWVASGGWITDYDKAREEAKKSGKPILAYFTRSYAP